MSFCHRCAYDSELGYRAVGVGYNLDDRTPEREREVSAVFSDWDRVSGGLWQNRKQYCCAVLCPVEAYS